MADMPECPRLLYRGAEDETAATRRVDTWAELEMALLDGWRLHRKVDVQPVAESPPDEPEPPPEDVTPDATLSGRSALGRYQRKG
jgi:hypothetical protein